MIPANRRHRCGACDNPATRAWQRYATEAELEAARADPDNPSVQAHEASAMVPVMGCDEHGLRDELATAIHQADCTAPPTCDCSPTVLVG